MRAKWLYAVLLTVAMCGLAEGVDDPKEAPKPPEGWVEYSPSDKIFNVFLPKGGKRTERTDTIPVKDNKIRLNILELESDGKGKFVARTLLIQQAMGGLPKPMIIKGKIVKPPPGPPAGLFPSQAEQQAMGEAMRDLFVKEVKGKIADEKEVMFGRVKGKEYQITITDTMSARVRVVVMGKLIHQFGIVGTKAQVEGRDADTFFESYRMPTREEKMAEKEKDKEKDK